MKLDLNNLFNQDIEIIEDNSEKEPLIEVEKLSKHSKPVTNKKFVKEMKEFQESEEIREYGIKEIILIRESQLPLISLYLNKIGLPKKGFVHFENNSFSKIKKLRPNLLREEYWVIGSHGLRGGINPGKEQFNKDVIENYLNHIIISYDWELMKRMDKETFTIPIKYNSKEYPYEVRFASTFGRDVIDSYIDKELGTIYDWSDLQRIKDRVNKDRKNAVDWVEAFKNLQSFTFEDVEASMTKGYSIIPPLFRTLATKGLRKDGSHYIPRGKRKVLWVEQIAEVINTKSESYLKTALRNNVKDIKKLKSRKGKVSDMNRKYMGYYLDQVDMINLMLLEDILNERKIPLMMLRLENYMKKGTKSLLKEEVKNLERRRQESKLY